MDVGSAHAVVSLTLLPHPISDVGLQLKEVKLNRAALVTCAHVASRYCF